MSRQYTLQRAPTCGIAFGSSNRLHVKSLFALCQQRRARAVAVGDWTGRFTALQARAFIAIFTFCGDLEREDCW